MNKKVKVILSIIAIILISLIITSVILIKNIIKEKENSNENVTNNYNDINKEQNINNNYYTNESNVENETENNNSTNTTTTNNNNIQNTNITTNTRPTGIAENEQDYEREMQKTLNNYFSDKITPRGISTLYGKYKGENDKNDLFRNFKKFVDYMEVLSNDTNGLNNNEIRKYYNNNKKTISDNLAQSEDEFYNFTKNMDGTIYKSSDFKYCEIDDSSYSDNDNYLTFNITFNYNNASLKVQVSFANNKGFEPEVVYQ